MTGREFTARDLNDAFALWGDREGQADAVAGLPCRPNLHSENTVFVDAYTFAWGETRRIMEDHDLPDIPGHASGGVPAGAAPEGRGAIPAPGAHPALTITISAFAMVGVFATVTWVTRIVAGVIA